MYKDRRKITKYKIVNDDKWWLRPCHVTQCDVVLCCVTFLDHRHDRVSIVHQQLTQRLHFSLNFNFNFNSGPCLSVKLISCTANPVWFTVTVTWRWSSRGKGGGGYRVSRRKGAEDFLYGYSLKVGYFGIGIQSEMVKKWWETGNGEEKVGVMIEKLRILETVK
jgi:hypothetical protein